MNLSQEHLVIQTDYSSVWYEIYLCVRSMNIAFARGGAHLPIAHALRLLSTNKIEIEKK